MDSTIGGVDRIAEDAIFGWARDPADSSRRITVGLVAGGRVVSRASAALLREDLASAGIGDGRYGFELPIPSEIRQRPQPVSVVALELDQALPILETETSAPSLIGSIDVASGETVEGWAWDPAYPDAVVTCVLEVEGVPMARQMATIHRADLVSAGIGDGNHGFRFVLPDEWRQGSIRINVRVEELNRNLTPEPVLRIPSLYSLDRAVEQHRIDTFGPMKASCFSPSVLQKHF